MKKILFATLLLLIAHSSFADNTTTFKIVDGHVALSLKNKMEKNVNSMIASFRYASENGLKSIKLDKECMTSAAISDVKEIWKYSGMCCPPMNILGRCIKTSTGYQVRGIPVDMIEADEDKARQELTVDFLPSGIISRVSIAIEMHRYDLIMAEKSDELDYARRQIIVNFIEDFRTAYNKRDLKFLTRVYSDKALIITGHVIREKQGTDMTRMTLNNNRVIYIKQTKQEYLNKLARVFKYNNYINVLFDEIEVVQHPKHSDIYGVTLKQYWNTSKYSDEGYLFLMIDFKDKDNPLIQVRTWQPYKDNKGNILTKKEDVYHLGSFRIVR